MRSTLAVLAYFASASASFAYYVAKAPLEPGSKFHGLHTWHCVAER